MSADEMDPRVAPHLNGAAPEPPDDDHPWACDVPDEDDGERAAIRAESNGVLPYAHPYSERQRREVELPHDMSKGDVFGREHASGAEKATKQSLVQRLRDRLVRVEPSWITEPPAPLDYLVRDTRTGRGAIEARGIGLLVAAGSAGKGFTSLALGVAVSTGVPWLGCMAVERKGRVLFVSAEDAARTHLRRRLYSVAKAMGVRELGDNIDILDIRDVHVPMLTPDGIPGEGAEALCELVREGGPYALIVVDPISKVAGASIDADNVNANALIGALEAISVASDGFVLGGHHSALRARLSQDTSATSSRGATGLTDSARAVMTLSVERLKHGDATLNAHLGDLVTVHLVKANHVRAWEPIVLRRCEDGELVPIDASDEARVEQARVQSAPAGKKKAAKEADFAGRLTEAAAAVVRAVRAKPLIGSVELRAKLAASLPGGCGQSLADAAVAHLGDAIIRNKKGRQVEHTLTDAELPPDVAARIAP